MTIDTDKIVTMSEANRNFSSVARFSRQHGGAVIFKDSRPAFVLTPIENYFELTDDEKIDICAKRILKRFKPAFEELAK